MSKSIPFVKIERNKKNYQFYYQELPIHPDRLFPILEKMNAEIIHIQVIKNNKLYWNAYYPLGEKNELQKIVWKAFKNKL